MATRTITAKVGYGATTDLLDGDYARFAVDTDSGAVAGALVTAARLYISSFRSYVTTYRLLLKYDAASGDALARTDAMAANSSSHAETVVLSECLPDMVTATPGNIYLVVEAISGTGNKINFRDGCTITLEIDYATRCQEPGNVTLAASESTDSVVLSWEAGDGGDDNPVSHYEVARALSVDGATWGDLETVGTTAELYMPVQPPQPFGAYYKYYVRTVGTAGTAYASVWAESNTTLRKIPPALVEYTDAEILPGITPVRAVHMTELQTNVNILRHALGLTEYAFSSIRAGYTGLKDWNAHILELRAAIDEATTDHDAWLALGDNCPRADVLLQVRATVDALAAENEAIT